MACVSFFNEKIITDSINENEINKIETRTENIVFFYWYG